VPIIKYAIFDVGQTVYPFSLNPLIAYMQKRTSEPEIFARDHSPHFYDYNPYMKGELTDAQFVEELCFFCRVPYNKKSLDEISITLHKGCGERFPETLQAMKRLRQNGAEICLLSNALPLLADTGADLVKPQHAFTSYDLKLLKPDPEIFSAVLKKLQAQPEQTLFIDDKRANVETAQQLGINGIVYQKETILQKINSYLLPFPSFHRSRED